MIAIACDMPLVPAKFLRWLAEIEAPVAVCEVGGRLEPLLGRYAPEASAALAAALADGAAMREAVAALDPMWSAARDRPLWRPGADRLQRQLARGPGGSRAPPRAKRTPEPSSRASAA